MFLFIAWEFKNIEVQIERHSQLNPGVVFNVLIFILTAKQVEIMSAMSHVGLTSVTWHPISKNIQFPLQNDLAFRPGELFKNINSSSVVQEIQTENLLHRKPLSWHWRCDQAQVSSCSRGPLPFVMNTLRGEHTGQAHIVLFNKQACCQPRRKPTRKFAREVLDKNRSIRTMLLTMLLPGLQI